jgi:hypothetical protein
MEVAFNYPNLQYEHRIHIFSSRVINNSKILSQNSHNEQQFNLRVATFNHRCHNFHHTKTFKKQANFAIARFHLGHQRIKYTSPYIMNKNSY